MTEKQTCEATNDLDYWLDEITVFFPDDLEPPHPQGWFAVETPEGVVAYFINKSDAFRFRLAEINRRLNG